MPETNPVRIMLRSAPPFRLYILSTIIFLFLSSCKDKNNDAAQGKGSAGKPKGVIADVYVVKSEAYSPTYTASGQLLANESVEIHPEVAGRVTGIYFSEGSAVRKGQMLLQLNDADIRAEIRKLQAQRGLQQSTQRRQAELLRIGGISRQEFEATQTNVRAIDADIAVSRANLARLKIVAPFDGIIGLRNVSPGAIVSPTTIVATLQQVSPLKMDFSIPDQYRNQLRLGQSVRFFIEGIQDTMLAKVSAIEPGAEATTHTVKIRAIVPNGDRKLMPGAFAHVVVPFGVQGASILIPTQSIIPTTRDKKVAIVRNGKAVMQTVVTGDRTQDRVQILQGLQMGDTILTTALMQVKAGMDVKVKKVS
jgi:membrane fusion protein, multidrug efflux system